MKCFSTRISTMQIFNISNNVTKNLEGQSLNISTLQTFNISKNVTIFRQYEFLRWNALYRLVHFIVKVFCVMVIIRSCMMLCSLVCYVRKPP